MGKKHKLTPPTNTQPADGCAAFIRKALPQITGWLILLVSVCFFTGTYDSAHVKLTLMQIGVPTLLVLWAALKITERKNPFTRRNVLFLAPLFIYLGWQTLSFVCFPYKLEAAEEFLRLLMYGGVSTLIACEFSLQDIRTLTKFIVATAWICLGYGLFQIANIWLPGVDLLPWHGFFGNRVFSTHANPNFFGAFIVFSSAIIGAQFVQTRKKSLLVLLAIGLIDLAFTESKGAWLAYGGMLVFAAFTYTNCMANVKKHLLKINLTALAVLLLAGAAAGVYSAKRFQSVSFRTYTWLSAFEMVKDSPLLGTGPGSFKLVYPAYRRPQIFYIENAHNNETQHAENELLEQLATGGIVGLALGLWLLAVLFVGTFKHLRVRPPEDPTRWLLLGYSAALAGLLMHSFVDISLHFASSGLLAAVFVGVLLALLISAPLAEVPTQTTAKYPRLLGLVRIGVTLVLVAAAGYALREFYFIWRNMAVQTWGEGILLGVAWLLWIGCTGALLYIYGKVLFKTTRVCVALLLLLCVACNVFFVRIFTANHYYSLGVALVQRGYADASLGAFNDAIGRNPFSAEYRHYRANVFATTLNLTKHFSSLRGDTDKARTDFDRAVDDFQYTLAHNPNHARLHQDIGQLYYSLGMRQLNAAQNEPTQTFLYQQLAHENFTLAHKALLKALALDPVNPDTYLMLSNMAVLRHDVDEAQHWLDVYYQGPDGVTEKEFLQQHRNNPQLQHMQQHVNRLRATLQP